LQEGEVPLAVDTEPEHVERVFPVPAEDSSKFTQPLLQYRFAISFFGLNKK
jgi:hypothetical protein